MVGAKFKPVAIGRLERFVADTAMGRGWDETPDVDARTQKKAAIIGSGPSGLACAGDLARNGVKVTIFEALHVAGGVLKYGIPEFRLPDIIIDAEIENMKKLGVEIRLDTIIGKLFTIPQLLTDMGYDAAFVGTGAGSPKFAGIPGEAFNGVFSANEFLTRVNLMRGHRQPIYDTPVGMGKRVAVVGAGNTAMDSCRVAKRMGAEKVTVVYRRSRRESPARVEELEHAIEEGIEFLWLTNPVEIVGNAAGLGHRHARPEDAARRARCLRPPPARRGRRLRIPARRRHRDLCARHDGQPDHRPDHPRPRRSTSGATSRSTSAPNMTSIPGLFAGGDIVTGAATVILAMGAGRRAARGMLEYMGVLSPDAPPELAAAEEIEMPSSCPKCRRVVEEDEICCAQVRYTWRCKSCFKLTSGFAIPYGKCFLCGGELELIQDRELGDSMRFQAIRDAVQFELNSFHFYKLARDKAANPEQRAVLERLYEAELDHLHELEEKYHAHLDREVVELSANEEALLVELALPRHQRDADGVADLYQAALEMERRTRDHFQKLARSLPPGWRRSFARSSPPRKKSTSPCSKASWNSWAEPRTGPDRVAIAVRAFPWMFAPNQQSLLRFVTI